MRPRNDDELYEYIKYHWGVVLPREAHCAKCTAPFKVFADSYFSRYPLIILRGSRGSGKFQPVDSPVLTPEGYVRMGDIKPGSKVVDQDGNIVNVTHIHPQGRQKVYRVTFSDGTSTECGDDHLWVVAREWKNAKWQVKPLKEFRKDLLKRDTNDSKWQIPVVEPIKFADKDLPIHPYLLGQLLSDGYIKGRAVTLTTADIETIDTISTMLPEGITISYSPPYQYRLNRGPNKKGQFLNRNILRTQLKELGLVGKGSNDKFIPKLYKFASIDQRLELLRGLMDGDGSCKKQGKGSVTSYYSTSLTLIKDVAFLVQSLGGTAKFTKGRVDKWHKVPLHRLYIKLDVCPFRLSRKANIWTPNKHYKVKRFIKKVDYIGLKECQCITVDSPTSTYLTNDCIVTHNSVLLALLALTEQVTLGNYVMILGASEIQSKVVFDYLSQKTTRFPGLWWDYKNAPKALQSKDDERVGQSRLLNGGFIRCSPASMTSVYGQRPVRLRMDEIDLMEMELIDGAIPCAYPMGDIQEQVLLASTSYSNDGTLNAMIERAEAVNAESLANGGDIIMPVYQFCYKDVLKTEKNPDGYLTADMLARMKSKLDPMTWQRQYENGDPINDDTIFSADEIADLFDYDLLGYDPNTGEPLELDGLPGPNHRITLDEKLWIDSEAKYHGVDWGDRVDWTIITSFCIPHSLEQGKKPKPDILFHFAKYGRWGMTKSVSEYNKVLEQWEGRGAHDSTGMGQVVEELLDNYSMPVKWSRENKTQNLNLLIEAIKERRIKMPNIKCLKKAFKNLSEDHLSGKKHLPDEVASVMMAWYARSKTYLDSNGIFGGTY